MLTLVRLLCPTAKAAAPLILTHNLTLFLLCAAATPALPLRRWHSRLQGACTRDRYLRLRGETLYLFCLLGSLRGANLSLVHKCFGGKGHAFRTADRNTYSLFTRLELRHCMLPCLFFSNTLAQHPIFHFLLQDVERDIACYRVACAGGHAKLDLHPRTTDRKSVV